MILSELIFCKSIAPPGGVSGVGLPNLLWMVAFKYLPYMVVDAWMQTNFSSCHSHPLTPPTPTGMSCKLPDPLAFKAMMLEKHIWICAFMLAGVKNGGVPANFMTVAWCPVGEWQTPFVFTPGLLRVPTKVAFSSLVQLKFGKGYFLK